MITSIRIKNVALIQKLELELQEGLNILSGETGAGKSIIIDSLNFVLGERADKSLIRFGEESAEVEAVFNVTKTPELTDVFDDLGIEFEDDTVILRRVMSISGRNDVRINGRAVTVQMLKRVSELLCDIHGQHEHQSLLRTSFHLDILDNFGENTLKKHRQLFDETYLKFVDICKKCEDFGDDSKVARELDMLDFAIKEIDKAELYDGIDEEIANIRTKLQNTERLAEAVRGANYLLSGDGGSSGCDTTYRAYNMLSSVSRYDESLQEFVDRLESVKIELGDIADSLLDIADGYVYSSEYATSIEEKYDLIKSLKRKYGATVSDVLSYRDQANERKISLENSQEERERLFLERENTADKLYEYAKALSLARRDVALDLEEQIFGELSELGMQNTTFKVNFSDIKERGEYIENLTRRGIDDVEFLISPNKGEPLKSLAKIISGGEMSRFMLALKVIISRIDGIGTLVFDEIDTGISGVIAHEVAKKLYKISKNAQVIAVTHLPQLAGIADYNYLIKKEVVGESTLTFVSKISDDEKISEVSRLSGGIESSEKSLLHAKDLVTKFDEFKKSI